MGRARTRIMSIIRPAISSFCSILFQLILLLISKIGQRCVRAKGAIKGRCAKSRVFPSILKAQHREKKSSGSPMTDWISLADQACGLAGTYLREMRAAISEPISSGGKIDRDLAQQHQRLVHGYAWAETAAAGLAATCDWARRAQKSGAFGAAETLILKIGFGEYLAQLTTGVVMSQNEIVRPQEFGLGRAISFWLITCLLYTSPSPRDRQKSRMPSSA